MLSGHAFALNDANTYYYGIFKRESVAWQAQHLTAMSVEFNTEFSRKSLDLRFMVATVNAQNNPHAMTEHHLAMLAQ